MDWNLIPAPAIVGAVALLGHWLQHRRDHERAGEELARRAADRGEARLADLNSILDEASHAAINAIRTLDLAAQPMPCAQSRADELRANYTAALYEMWRCESRIALRVPQHGLVSSAFRDVVTPLNSANFDVSVIANARVADHETDDREHLRGAAETIAAVVRRRQKAFEKLDDFYEAARSIIGPPEALLSAGNDRQAPMLSPGN